MSAPLPSPLGDVVLDAALRCFEALGWQSTTIAAVAAEAGVEPSAVQAQWRSTEGLAQGIMTALMDQLPEEFADEIEPGAALEERLYAMLAHELRVLEPFKGFVADLMSRAMNPFDSTWFDQLGPVQQYTAFALQEIAEARARGEIARWVLPPVAAAAFWAIHLRVIRHWLRDESMGSAETHARAVVWIGLFLRSMGGRPFAD